MARIRTLTVRVPPPLTVPDQDALVLRQWIDAAAPGEAAARRANIVLLAGEGLGPTAISDVLRCSKQTVITWRERYRHAGIAGLRDAPRPGRPATVCAETLIRRTLDAPPGGARRWTTRTLGAELGVSNASVGHVWRTWGVTPTEAGQVGLATEPVLDGRLAAITGIHLGPEVRVLAARGGEPGDRTPATSDLGKLLAGPRTPTDGDEDVEGFLRRIGDGATTVLITDGRVASAPPGAAVHTVPPGQCWVRVAQVACWVVEGGSREGAESVEALGAVLEDHLSGTVLSWSRP
jgi:transposase